MYGVKWAKKWHNISVESYNLNSINIFEGSKFQGNGAKNANFEQNFENNYSKDFESDYEPKFEYNIFKKGIENDENIEKEVEMMKNDAENPFKKKRLNDFDADILNKNIETKKKTSFGKINYVKCPNFEKKTNLKTNFLYKLFPRLYKTKLVKEAVEKIKYLSEMSNELTSKQIPYGEQDERYKKLVDFLKYVNIVQADLKNVEIKK